MMVMKRKMKKVIDITHLYLLAFSVKNLAFIGFPKSTSNDFIYN